MIRPLPKILRRQLARQPKRHVKHDRVESLQQQKPDAVRPKEESRERDLEDEVARQASAHRFIDSTTAVLALTTT